MVLQISNFIYKKIIHFFIGAIVNPTKDDFTKSSVDYLIGDLLKRAVKKVVVPNTPEHYLI